jgi:hypothetical protein
VLVSYLVLKLVRSSLKIHNCSSCRRCTLNFPVYLKKSLLVLVILHSTLQLQAILVFLGLRDVFTLSLSHTRISPLEILAIKCEDALSREGLPSKISCLNFLKKSRFVGADLRNRTDCLLILWQRLMDLVVSEGELRDDRGLLLPLTICIFLV